MTDVHDWHETFRLHAEQGRGDPFAAAVRATRMAMIVTDPRQPDNPIVYANASFLKMSGYEADEILGRNCRFLQGPDTDRSTVDIVRAAIENEHDVAVDLLNYRKDGTAFWNALYLSPVRGEDDEVQFFFASQIDVSDRVHAQANLAKQQAKLEAEVRRRTAALEEALAAKTILVHEVDHRVKNNLQMVASILNMQMRTASDPAVRTALKGTLSRVESIGTVHRRLYQSHDVATFDLAGFLRDLAEELLLSSGRSDVGLRFDMAELPMRSAQATSVALLFNEVMTNALKHAFPDGRAGMLTIKLASGGDRSLIALTDDGIGMGGGTEAGSGFGSRMIKSIVRQLQGTVTWRDGSPGTVVEISFPTDLEVQSGRG